MRKWLALVCLISIASVAAFGLHGPGAPSDRDEKLWEYRNLGKAFYENPDTHQQAVDQLKLALDLAPDSPRERINYGLALLRAGQVDAGVAELKKAQAQDPTLPHTWFNLGIAYKHAGDYEHAIEQFEGMIRLVPNEPVGHYNLGAVLRSKGDSVAALKEFQQAAQLNPDLAGPHFQIFSLYQRARETEKAAAERALFEDSKRRHEGAAVPEDMEWCYWAELSDPPSPRPDQLSRMTYARTTLAGAGPHALAADLAGKGEITLLTWSETRLLSWPADGSKARTLFEGHGIRDVVVAHLRNTAENDLIAVTDEGVFLLRSGSVQSIVRGSGFFKALPLDFDHDNDLDVLIFGTEPTLLRNQGDGRLEPHPELFPFVKGQATDAVATAIREDTAARDVIVSYAERPGTLYRDDLNQKFTAAELPAIEAGTRNLTVADVNHDTLLDVIAYQGAGQGKVILNIAGKYAADSKLQAPPRTLDADFNGDGRDDRVEFGADGTLTLALNTTGNQRWLPVRLVGVKNPKPAVNATVEIRAGELYDKRVYQGRPLSFAIGERTEVDTVRITWPNGLIQNETHRKATGTQQLAKLDTIEEAQRLSGSCPMIFTWNGERFEFITDVLGVAPLGASAGDGHYFPVDHDEYVQIPGAALKAVDGQLEVRITEELHEVSYLDSVKLIALDHPMNEVVYTNDKFKSPPYPEFRLFGGQRLRHAVRAIDNEGRDQTAAVSSSDGSYAKGFSHNVAGVSRQHTLDLDFTGAAVSNRAVLVLNGWVDWADGSTFLGAAQTGHALQFPSLQVKDKAGRWVTVIDDMGIPSGKPKTIAVDLTGKFLTSDRHVRIVTNLCVYWDEVGLLDESSAPAAHLTEMVANNADLRFRGFSRLLVDQQREHPESFAYDDAHPVSNWNPTAGNYTRYGSVTTLLAGIDDKLVIMGSGDELRLHYPAANLPPLKTGWTRDYLLAVDGWAKDADANTAYSQSVLPLPFHDMSAYPYTSAEHYPDDTEHRTYQQEYLTRPALRLIRPLALARH